MIETKPLSKSDFLSKVAESSGFSKKEIAVVFDGLMNVVQEQLSKDGPGAVTIPGLVKISVVEKPAKPAGTKPNPFKPGEMMEVKAKPASRVVKIRPLKTLKDMA